MLQWNIMPFHWIEPNGLNNFADFQIACISMLSLRKPASPASGELYCPNGCGQKYRSKCNLNRHLRYGCGTPPMFKCPVCEKPFARKDNLKSHMIIRHHLVVWRWILLNIRVLHSNSNLMSVFCFVFIEWIDKLNSEFYRSTCSMMSHLVDWELLYEFVIY